jgi:hypothetical protein
MFRVLFQTMLRVAFCLRKGEIACVNLRTLSLHDFMVAYPHLKELVHFAYPVASVQ